MSKIDVVSLPPLDPIRLVLQSKRDIRSHETYGGMNDESHEWFYWNRLWASEVALSEYVIQEFYPNHFAGKTILELGCGCGLAGLVSAKLGGVVTFSDKVPMVMETIQEECRLNAVSNYRTQLLDWTEAHASIDQYEVVLGSEIFYDHTFLKDIRRVLVSVLSPDGIGLFCDPDRLGVEAIETFFSQDFTITITKREVEWPRRKSGQPRNQTVLLYELKKHPSVRPDKMK